MSLTPRDTQRQRVYDAGEAMAEFDAGPMTWTEVEAFCAKINQSKWFRARWRTSITPQLKRGGSAYGYPGGRITLPLFARNPVTILHEVAHTVTSTGIVAPHGPEFCGVFLALVRHFMGVEAAKRLRANMRTYRVKVDTRAVPAARFSVVSASAVAQQRAAYRSKKLSTAERQELVLLLRRAASSGVLGASGRKPRAHALEVARIIESIKAADR